VRIHNARSRVRKHRSKRPQQCEWTFTVYERSLKPAHPWLQYVRHCGLPKGMFSGQVSRTPQAFR
jgi:hypothetical protein